MIDPEILQKVQERVKQYHDGLLVPSQESFMVSGSAKILYYDFEKRLREFEFADERQPDYEELVELLDKDFKTLYKLGIIKKNNSKDEIMANLQNQIKEKDLEIEKLNRQLIDEKRQTDYWGGRYNELKESKSDKNTKFRR
ncbi:MAG: hypothetical protein ACREA7_03395 [Nitrosotalea sp.]